MQLSFMEVLFSRSGKGMEEKRSLLSFTLECDNFAYNSEVWDLMTEQVLRANLLSRRIMESHHSFTLHPILFIN